MSNTTFDAKQAVKYMIDGLTVECIKSGNTFKMTEILYFKTDNVCEYSFDEFIECFESNTFKLAGKNLVEYYRPKEVWHDDEKCPTGWGIFYSDRDWWRCKEECIKFYSTSLKVVEWETKLMPATWEECE